MKESIKLEIQELKKCKSWDIIRKRLLRKLRRDPTKVILLTYLSNAYFEEGKYKKALKASIKACSRLPENPLVLWDYAHALYMNSEFSKSLGTFKAIMCMRPTFIAKSMTWKIENAKEFWNASRFNIALCYIQFDKLGLAVRALESYLKHLPDCGAYYSPELTKEKIKNIRRLNAQVANKALRVWMIFIEIRETSAKKSAKYVKGFTTGFVLAKTAYSATVSLKKELAALGFELVEAEDVTEFERARLKTELPEETEKLALETQRSKHPQFTDFFMYK
ncbi:MAG: tetratricopeptide repeat protein [Planctomycetota bacterium]|jgi:cytochrome c-type biogenesis protein CcmH/NrfG